jgi:hypothetical protein
MCLLKMYPNMEEVLTLETSLLTNSLILVSSGLSLVTPREDPSSVRPIKMSLSRPRLQSRTA